MTCVICRHGETKPGYCVVTLQREDSVVVFKGVPAEICRNCGEYYLDDAVADELLQRAERTVATGAEVAVQRYAA
jgi:YgiT-type zinc finger domain-containing protein